MRFSTALINKLAKKTYGVYLNKGKRLVHLGNYQGTDPEDIKNTVITEYQLSRYADVQIFDLSLDNELPTNKDQFVSDVTMKIGEK